MLYSGYRIVHWFFIITFIICSVSAALLRQATYGTLKIGIYQKIKRFFAEDIRRLYLESNFSFSSSYFFLEEKLYINVLNGMFSGALANAIANPTDLLKVKINKNEMYYWLVNLDSYASESSKCSR